MKQLGNTYFDVERIALIADRKGRSFVDVYRMMQRIYTVVWYRHLVVIEESEGLHYVAMGSLHSAQDDLDNLMAEWKLCATDRAYIRGIANSLPYND